MTDEIFPTHIDIHLGRRLRQRRRMLGLTQEQVGVLVGVRFQQIQKYECAANKMFAAQLWRLCEALHTTPDFFYDGLQTLRSANENVDIEHMLESQVGMEQPH